MLARAALPLLRPQRFPPAVRLIATRLQSRHYAVDKRSKKTNDYKLPASAKKPRWQEEYDRLNPTAQALLNQQRAPLDREAEVSDLEESLSSATSRESGTAANKDDVNSSASEFPSPKTQNADDAGSTQFTPEDESIFSEHHPSDKSGSPLEQYPPESDASPNQQQPLPDLTQGIPSTIEAELREARLRQTTSTKSLNITEDPSEPLPSGAGRGGDGLPRSAYISSNDQKKNSIVKYTYIIVAGMAVGYTIWLGRNWDSEEEAAKYPDAPSGWGIGLFSNRVKARLGSTLDYYNEPAFPKLLPDHDPKLQSPFCLVLGLEDLLIHQEWTRERGWRIAKRPGVDYFIRYLSQYYELVFFTTQPAGIASQVIQKLDPFRIVMWPLYREATLYKDGEYIKDLKYLNRDLSKVMMIDTDPAHARHQPENAIILPKWTGDPHDQTLVQMIPFLEYVATMGFDDTRSVLKSFEGKYIPAEFARREKLLREKFEAKMEEERKKRPKRKVGGLSSLFGMKTQQSPDGLENSIEAYEHGKMLWDQIRERGQKQYELIDKQIREEGQKWLEEEAANEKKWQEEQMKSMKSGFAGWALGLLGRGGDKGEQESEQAQAQEPKK